MAVKLAGRLGGHEGDEEVQEVVQPAAGEPHLEGALQAVLRLQVCHHIGAAEDRLPDVLRGRRRRMREGALSEPPPQRLYSAGSKMGRVCGPLLCMMRLGCGESQLPSKLVLKCMCLVGLK